MYTSNVNPVAIINQQPNNRARDAYVVQRNQTITFVVVGVLLALAAIIGCYFTMDAPVIFPRTCALVLTAGIGIALRPILYDWKPYHKNAYAEELKRDFRVYQAHETKEFLTFASRYQSHPERLKNYGWISNLTLEHFQNQCKNAVNQHIDIVPTYRERWNHYVENSNLHAANCQECKKPINPPR